MRVSVIATTYNEAKSIRNLIEALENQSRKPDEIIICDGGSTDNTINLLGQNVRAVYAPYCNIKHCDSPVAEGRNIAIKESTGDVIAVTDAGCIPNKYWLEEIVKPFENEHIQVVAGNTEAKIDSWFQKVITPFMPTFRELRNNPSSRSIAFRKYVWEAVGGYPTVALTAEDTLFNEMWGAGNFRHTYADKAIVFWKLSPDLKHFLRQQYRYSKGDAICALRWSMHLEILLRFTALALSFYFGIGFYVLGLYLIYLGFKYVKFSLVSAPMKLLLDVTRLIGFSVGVVKRLRGKNW